MTILHPFVALWQQWYRDGDITEAAVLAALAGLYHKHNCHQPRCWRIGRHTVNGTPWCNHHHTQARGASQSAGNASNPSQPQSPTTPPASTDAN